MTGHDHLLLLELLGDLSRTGSGDFDPGFGEEGALRRRSERAREGKEGEGRSELSFSSRARWDEGVEVRGWRAEWWGERRKSGREGGEREGEV